MPVTVSPAVSGKAKEMRESIFFLRFNSFVKIIDKRQGAIIKPNMQRPGLDINKRAKLNEAKAKKTYFLFELFCNKPAKKNAKNNDRFTIADVEAI